jgi:hypothetical protein
MYGKDCECDLCYFGEENKATLRQAKRRGQTFNKLIREYNKDPRAYARFIQQDLDMVQQATEVCTACHIRPRKDGNRFLCEECHVAAGEMSATLGTAETEMLLESVIVPIDDDQLHADEPLY